MPVFVSNSNTFKNN